MKHKNISKILIALTFLFLFNIKLIALNNITTEKAGYGIDENINTEKLSDKPVEISHSAEKDDMTGLTILNSDYYMVSKVTVSALSSLLIDLNSASEIFDRIIYSKDLTPENTIKYPHIQEVHASYKFLGIGTEYRYKVRVCFDIVSETEFAMRWELCDSMNSGLADLRGSWYLKELNIDGEAYTYLRSFASTKLERTPPGLLFFTRNFGEFEIRKTFKNLLSDL